jgi:steroid Delta-isomerase
MDRITQHIEAFNHAVGSGDWQTFSKRFAAGARMSFVGVPAGPYVGRPAIAEAYETNPPTDTIATFETTNPTSDTVHFSWSSGAAGTMRFAWAPTGEVQELTVTFD